MITSEDRNGHVFVRRGMIEARAAIGDKSQVIYVGTAAYLWWVKDGDLWYAAVDYATLALTNPHYFGLTGVQAYSAKFVPATGWNWAVTDGTNVTTKFGDAADAKVSVWAGDPLVTIDFEIDPTNSSVYVAATAASSTANQGYVQNFVAAVNKIVEEFFVYDFSMGPQKLPEKLAVLWN